MTNEQAVRSRQQGVDDPVELFSAPDLPRQYLHLEPYAESPAERVLLAAAPTAVRLYPAERHPRPAVMGPGRHRPLLQRDLDRSIVRALVRAVVLLLHPTDGRQHCGIAGAAGGDEHQPDRDVAGNVLGRSSCAGTPAVRGVPHALDHSDHQVDPGADLLHSHRYVVLPIVAVARARRGVPQAFRGTAAGARLLSPTAWSLPGVRQQRGHTP